MKNIIAIISLLFLFSCEDNLSSKTPTFEATVNGNNHWIANNYSAVIQNNQLSISANNQFGAISIFLDSVAIDQYNFYSWTEDFAVFQDTLQYSTQNDGIGSIAYLSDGFLDIHEIDNINNTISGHFHFDAYNASGEYTINISDGVFYKIPVNLGVQD